MDLLQQCAQWFENGEHQKIVDAIEALPEEERTPELDSELSRAYNNVAEATDRKLFRKAVALLKRHEAYFEREGPYTISVRRLPHFPAMKTHRISLRTASGASRCRALPKICARERKVSGSALPRRKRNFDASWMRTRNMCAVMS